MPMIRECIVTTLNEEGRVHIAPLGLIAEGDGWIIAPFRPSATLDNLRATPYAVDKLFRLLQFVSASFYSLGHGGNDAQKTMGIIAVLLYSQGMLGDKFYVPFWVVLTCQAAMGLGTLIGGWRIVKTMGSKITRLTPVQGFCAETGGAITLFMATELGVPVSTTHTITGAIIGVGAARRVAAVRWNIASGIVMAWIITIPASALIAAVTYAAVAWLR